jgi:hypothetical protein
MEDIFSYEMFRNSVNEVVLFGFHKAFLLVLVFDPEDGRYKFLRNAVSLYQII